MELILKLLMLLGVFGWITYLVIALKVERLGRKQADSVSEHRWQLYLQAEDQKSKLAEGHMLAVWRLDIAVELLDEAKAEEYYKKIAELDAELSEGDENA